MGTMPALPALSPSPWASTASDLGSEKSDVKRLGEIFFLERNQYFIVAPGSTERKKNDGPLTQTWRERALRETRYQGRASKRVGRPPSTHSTTQKVAVGAQGSYSDTRWSVYMRSRLQASWPGLTLAQGRP
jgi:hypothetical protein